MTLLVLAPIVAGVLSFVLTQRLTPLLRQRGQLDVPGIRSSHRHPTPRGGGAAIVLTIAIAIGILHATGYSPFTAGFYIAAALIAVCGWLDDVYDMSPVIRLSVHLIAGILVVATAPEPVFGIMTCPSWLWYPAALLWIVALINIYNFLDGIDGYAAVQAIVAGVGIWICYSDPGIRLVAAITAAASIGFLPFNWHPAKVFMGDTGSTSLGFLFAALPFYIRSTPFDVSIFLTTALLWLFLADGTYTIGRRVLRLEKIWEPHRSHLYQRLNIAGWSHSRIVVFVATLQVALVAAITACVRRGSVLYLGIAITAVLCFLIMLLAARRLEAGRHDAGPTG